MSNAGTTFNLTETVRPWVWCIVAGGPPMHLPRVTFQTYSWIYGKSGNLYISQHAGGWGYYTLSCVYCTCVSDTTGIDRYIPVELSSV